MAWLDADHSGMQHILKHWFYSDGAQGLPEDYLCFDLETTGFSAKEDLIVEIGWAIVRKRQIVDCDSAVLNWYAYPGMDHNWLTERLHRTASKSAENGVHYHFTPERLLAEGGPPIEILQRGLDLLQSAMARDEALVGQSVWSFDRRMLDAAKVRFVDGLPVPWLVGGVLDVGLFEKSSQIETKRPWVGESYNEWLQRSLGGGGVKWSMFNHIIPKYELAQRFNLDLSQAHRAALDCRCVWAAMETFREIVEAAVCK